MESIIAAIFVTVVLLFLGYLYGMSVENNHRTQEFKQCIVKRLGHVPINKMEVATVYVKFDKYGNVEEYSFNPPVVPAPETPPAS
jgi:archaellum component FlaF (FlaF/FlaG flagellin family)